MLMQTNMTEGDQRLLNAADLMRYDADPGNFTMRSNTTQWNEKTGWCGTPQCVMGHYMMLTKEGAPMISLVADALVAWQRRHFEITDSERRELFGAVGCDDADTPNEAADYIERFVAARIAARAAV